MHPVLHRNLQTSAHEILIATLGDPSPERAALARWTEAHRLENEERYGSAPARLGRAVAARGRAGGGGLSTTTPPCSTASRS